MGQLDQFAKETFALETATVTRGAVAWQLPPELGMSEVRLDGVRLPAAARLEADGDALVSLVAERDGVVVGHVLFSRMDVEADGTALSAAGLAPVSVAPGSQGQGIGDALIRAGLGALREQGVAASFVLGHEGYYPRFGYSPGLAARFASPFAGPHFMAMMLDSDAPWPLGGRADYAPAFGRMG